MGSAWQTRTRSYDGKNLLSYCFFAGQFASRNLLPQLVQSAVIVISRVPNRLTEFGRDLLKREPLEEEKVQSLSLAFRKFSEPALHGFTPVEGGVRVIEE